MTISFGLRNVEDTSAALTELRRVTRPGGMLVVCEFSTPTWRPFRVLYRNYLVAAIPQIAWIVSSNPVAYEYLAESIQAWPDQAGLARGCGSRLAGRRVAQPVRRDRRPAPRHRVADRGPA